MVDSQTLGAQLRALRKSRGMTQGQLATAAGVSRSSIIDLEQGKATLELRIVLAVVHALQHDLDLTASRRPSQVLAMHRSEVLHAARRYHLTNVRVFGSAARGDDGRSSDIDLLVHAPAGMHPGDFYGFQEEVEKLTGFDVDLLADDLKGAKYDAIRSSAVPL